MFEKIKNFFLQQLRQGMTPQGLALTCTVGVTMALMPAFGVTTGLCLLIGTWLRLNHPVLQAVNYAMSPVQLLLIPVFLKLGAWIFQVPAVSINPMTMAQEFMATPGPFLAQYGWAVLQAVAAWALLAPFIAFLTYQILLAVFKTTVKEPALEPKQPA